MNESLERLESSRVGVAHEKIGYLREPFRWFHLNDVKMREFDWHYHDFHKILWLVSGKVQYHVEGKSYDLQPYDLLLIGRGAIHRPEVDFSQPYERYVLYLSEGYLDTFQQKGADLNLCFQTAEARGENLVRIGGLDNSRLLASLRRMEENRPEDGFAGQLYGEALFLEFMIELNRVCLKGNGEVFGPAARYDPRILEIVQYINGHLAEELTVEQLAGLMFVSQYHMMRKFKADTGYSVHQYIVEKRILKAKDMIVSGMPAGNACMECGFKDYSAFSRAFRKRFGVAPSDALDG